jgi:hypothetical protein
MGPAGNGRTRRATEERLELALWLTLDFRYFLFGRLEPYSVKRPVPSDRFKSVSLSKLRANVGVGETGRGSGPQCRVNDGAHQSDDEARE